MQKYQRLEDVSYVSNAGRIVNLDSLPPGHRVRKINMLFELSGTKDAADALDGQEFARAVSLIRLHNFCNIPGWNLQELMKQVYGRIIFDPTDVPGSGTTFSMDFMITIPFNDPRQPGSDDGSIPTELLQSRALEIIFATDNTWAVGNLVVTAGTVRVDAELVIESDVPQLMTIGYEDPGSQTIPLRPGVYKDLFINDGNSSGTVTRAEIANVDLEVDGVNVWNNQLHQQVIAAYNGDAVRDSAAELTDNAATRFPLIWHNVWGKSNISKQPVVEKQGKVQLTGTMTTPRIVFWKALEKDQEAIARIALATGAPQNATRYEPSTASKRPLRSAARSRSLGRQTKKQRILSRVLGGKVRTPADDALDRGRRR